MPPELLGARFTINRSTFSLDPRLISVEQPFQYRMAKPALSGIVNACVRCIVNYLAISTAMKYLSEKTKYFIKFALFEITVNFFYTFAA